MLATRDRLGNSPPFFQSPLVGFCDVVSSTYSILYRLLQVRLCTKYLTIWHKFGMVPRVCQEINQKMEHYVPI